MVWAADADVFSSHPGKLEHGGNVQDIFLACFLETRLRLQVVVAIRQSQPAGADVGQHPRRFVRILLAAERERISHQNVVHLGHHALQFA